MFLVLYINTLVCTTGPFEVYLGILEDKFKSNEFIVSENVSNHGNFLKIKTNSFNKTLTKWAFSQASCYSSDFLRNPQNLKKSSSWSADLLSKRQKHEEDLLIMCAPQKVQTKNLTFRNAVEFQTWTTEK